MTGHWDAIVLGAGAAGMMCAIHAAAGCARVLVIDHARAPGEKIRISGGGRCNFTNLHTAPHSFLSENPHFAKSALARYTPQDFLALVGKHRIAWHEKTLGQLFCDRSAKDVIAMLVNELAAAGAELRLQTAVTEIARAETGFRLTLDDSTCLETNALVVATGGKSIPKMGATGFGYRVAEQFGLAVTDTRAALVPLTFCGAPLDAMKSLAGVAVPAARVACNGTAFGEALLFTHRGLSGPAILQISSYWREGDPITVDLLPGRDPLAELRARRASDGRRALATVLSDHLPTRLAAHFADDAGRLADLPDRRLRQVADTLSSWTLTPAGSEGYRTAEVTLGGVCTSGLDARTMEARKVPGLHFIGEVVDVTGWLGGYNFQWAWASGHAAGTAIAAR